MERNLTQRKISDIFHEAFPMYLAIGMTYEQFWEQESWLVKSYRKAQEIRQNESNYLAWLNGVYVLQALRSGMPVYLTGIAKSHVTLPEFPEKPIDLASRSKEENQAKQMELQKARMQMMVEQFNATFRRKQEQAIEDKK